MSSQACKGGWWNQCLNQMKIATKDEDDAGEERDEEDEPASKMDVGKTTGSTSAAPAQQPTPTDSTLKFLARGSTG
jgi:hypothetical protein